MKKITLLLLIFICTNCVFGQNDLTEVEKLATTAKVWGFLKYYHPKVANGKYDWDNELFKILPKVKSSTNKVELSQVYTEWIDNLGKINKSKRSNTVDGKEYFDKNFDLGWIDNTNFLTNELSQKLRYVESNRHQGKKKYAAVAHRNVKNIQIKNEVEYKNFDYYNEDLRLLSLFRYWNIIEYFFPYKYQTDTNWDDVLNKMIPKFLNVANEEEYHLAMLELIVSADDAHANLVNDKTNNYFGYFWIPASFKLVDNTAVITGFYNDSLSKLSDLKIGDIITKVNNKDIAEIVKEREKYINGSNPSSKMRNFYYGIFNGQNDSVEIEYIRDNQTHNKSVKRYYFKDFNYKWAKNLELYNILDGNIGYVNMGILERKDVANIMEKLKDTKAIIFDIRNYPKGTLGTVGNYIISERKYFYKYTYPDLDYPGKFIWKNGERYGAKEGLKYKGKVILLVNEETQSHAEFTAMHLQTGDHVTTIGSQTAGADGNVSEIEMVGGYKTSISGIGIFYPDNTETQRKGVKIDLEVFPTIQGIIDGRDEVLEKAVKFIN